jgi:hypothetical protein
MDKKIVKSSCEGFNFFAKKQGIRAHSLVKHMMIHCSRKHSNYFKVK